MRYIMSYSHLTPLTLFKHHVSLTRDLICCNSSLDQPASQAAFITEGRKVQSFGYVDYSFKTSNLTNSPPRHKSRYVALSFLLTLYPQHQNAIHQIPSSFPVSFGEPSRKVIIYQELYLFTAIPWCGGYKPVRGLQSFKKSLSKN